MSDQHPTPQWFTPTGGTTTAPRPDAAARHGFDGAPVRDAEPTGARLGRLSPGLREHHALARLERAVVEHALGRSPTAEAAHRDGG